MATSANFPIYGFVDEIFSFSEENWRRYFKPVVSDGVQNGLEATAGTGMTINIASGECHCGAVMGILTNAISLDINNGDNTYARIDSIAVQYLYGEPSTLSIIVIQGTPSSNPTTPTLSKVFDSLWQMEIAEILVPANATSSNQCTITNIRQIDGPIDEEINAITTELLSITNEINIINTEISSITTDIITIDDEILSITTNINSITTDIEILDDEILSITTEINSITTDIDEIDDKIISIQQIITENIESGMIATKNYTSGDFLIVNDIFYKIIDTINNGESIVVGTNVIKTTIAEQLMQTRFLRK